MNKAIILAISGVVLLAGCGNQGKKTSAPVEPKWKGAPYRLTFDATPGKGKTANAVTIPAVTFTANPDALETRIVMVAKFNVPAPAFKDQPAQRMIGSAVDIHGEEGALPAEYTAQLSKQLSDYVTAYCADGKLNLTVALARSSLNTKGTDGDVEAKRLSDWMPLDVTVKKAGGKCK